MKTGWLALSAVLAAAPLSAAASPGYRVALPAEVEVEEGQGGAVSLTIAPDAGYSISTSGPLRVSLSAVPAGGLELPRQRYQRSHAADRLADAPRFDLAVRGVRAGDCHLTVDVRFWLCRGRVCRPIRDGRSVAVRVKPARPAPRPTFNPGGET